MHIELLNKKLPGLIIEFQHTKGLPLHTLVLVFYFNTQRTETLRREVRKQHAEKRKRLAEKEDKLRKRLEEKDAHINSHLKQISDLQQQLKVTI